MPEFVSPFTGMVPERKLIKNELVRAIRLNIAAELEAVHLYVAHADATDNEFAKAVLVDIANEERKHIGEFYTLLKYLEKDEQSFLDQGRGEVEALAQKLNIDLSANEPAGGPGETIPTIGNLKK